MPAYIPLSIATFSIIGEKQARSLEPVLAAPIRTVELLAGKVIAALVPGVAGRLAHLPRVRGPRVVRLRAALFGVVTDPSWLMGVFVLGPAIGLSSVVAGVIVSSRVTDPRVAQQIGGIIIVPIIAVILFQATGTILVGRDRLLRARGHRPDRQPGRACGSASPVRPGGDPDPLALTRRTKMQRIQPAAGSERYGPICLAYLARPSRYDAAMTRRPTPFEWLVFLTLAFCWGSSYLFIKFAVDDFGTFTLVALRLAVGATLLGRSCCCPGSNCLANRRLRPSRGHGRDQHRHPVRPHHLG